MSVRTGGSGSHESSLLAQNQTDSENLAGQREISHNEVHTDYGRQEQSPKSSQALTEANRIASPLNPVVMIPEDIRLKGNALTPALGCSRNYANPVPYGNKEEQQATGTT